MNSFPSYRLTWSVALIDASEYNAQHDYRCKIRLNPLIPPNPNEPPDCYSLTPSPH